MVRTMKRSSGELATADGDRDYTHQRGLDPVDFRNIGVRPPLEANLATSWVHMHGKSLSVRLIEKVGWKADFLSSLRTVNKTATRVTPNSANRSEKGRSEAASHGGYESDRPNHRILA